MRDDLGAVKVVIYPLEAQSSVVENKIISKAIVVGVVNYGDTHRIAHILTPERGLISAIARRVRSPKHKLAGVLDLGNILEVQLSPPKKDLYLLQTAHELVSTGIIRNNLHKIAIMMYCCEIAKALSVPENPAPKLYGLLEHTIHLLNQLDQPNTSMFNGFAVKALAFTGQPPQLHTCDLCNCPATDSRYFHPMLGSMVHKSCLDTRQDIPTQTAYFTPSNWATTVHNLLHMPLHDSWLSEFPRTQNGNRSSVWLLTEMIEHIIERQIRSRSLLQPLFI